MAFSRDGWGPWGGQSRKGSAPQAWLYTTTDAKTVVDAAGYFNGVSDDVAVHDVIYSVGSTGGTATATLHVVLSNASGVVDVSDGLAITMTDSR